MSIIIRQIFFRHPLKSGLSENWIYVYPPILGTQSSLSQAAANLWEAKYTLPAKSGRERGYVGVSLARRRWFGLALSWKKPIEGARASARARYTGIPSFQDNRSCRHRLCRAFFFKMYTYTYIYALGQWRTWQHDEFSTQNTVGKESLLACLYIVLITLIVQLFTPIFSKVNRIDSFVREADCWKRISVNEIMSHRHLTMWVMIFPVHTLVIKVQIFDSVSDYIITRSVQHTHTHTTIITTLKLMRVLIN